jgi:hypothetical protein
MPTPESTTSNCTVAAELRVRTVSVPPSGNRVDCVENEIRQRIADLAFLSENGRERLLQLGAHGDCDPALLRQIAPPAARQLDHLRHDRIQVDLRVRRLPVLRPIEIAHAFHGLADVGDCAADDAQVAAGALAQAGLVFQQRIGVQRNGARRRY